MTLTSLQNSLCPVQTVQAKNKGAVIRKDEPQITQKKHTQSTPVVRASTAFCEGYLINAEYAKYILYH